MNVWKEKFEELCNPLKNLTILRRNLYNRGQQPEHSLQVFYGYQKLAELCEFVPIRSEMMKDRVVIGILFILGFNPKLVVKSRKCVVGSGVKTKHNYLHALF